MIKPFVCLAFLVVFTGCASSASPSAFERMAYLVTTQRVEVVVLRTNITATATNVLAVPAIIEIPHFEPRPEVMGGIQTAGVAATGFGAPWLVPVLGLLGGLYGWWAEFRNRQKTKMAGVLTNNVQVGHETILATAGAAVAAQFVEAIKSAQVRAGVKSDIAAMVDNKVDKAEARHEAASVVSLAKRTPVPSISSDGH